MRRSLFQTLVAIVVLLLGAQTASAIPAFARREGVPCGTCHYRANRLNQIGLDYYRQGFRFAVAPPAKEAKAEAVKTDSFGNYFTIQGILDYKKNEKKAYTTSNKVTLFGAGALNEKWSFLAETTVNPADAQEVADLFIGYTTGGESHYAFLRAGQMLPLMLVDNPLEIANDHSAAFPRDRRQGAAAGYNFGKMWIEGTLVAPAGTSTRNNVDAVVNGQYIFTGNGSSLGAYAWAGKFNQDSKTSDDYNRVGVVGNFNELKKLLIAVGYSGGKGDSGGGGNAKTKGVFAQAEYLFSDRTTVFLHVLRADPNTSISGDSQTTYTASLNYWPYEAVALAAQLTSDRVASKTDNGVRLRLRLMF